MYIIICKTCTLSYVKQMTRVNSVHEYPIHGTQSQCSGTTQRDGVGSEFQDGGTHVNLWPIHVDTWQKPSQYCKVIILQ